MEYVNDIASESLCVGYVYNRPEILDEFGDQIFPKYDFTDETIQFLYNILVNCWYQQGKINDVALNVYVSSLSEEDKQKFHNIGGCNAYKRFGNVADKSVDKFDKIITRLKTYNVLRALQKKNINVLPYIDRFKDKDPDYVLKVYETALNQIGIYSVGVGTPQKLSEGMDKYIEQLKNSPDVGYDTPFDLVNYYTRGIRLKTIICMAAGTNQGKTRILTNWLAHTSVESNTNALLISTEQTEEEMKLQFITSVCNNLIKDESKFINEADIAKDLLDEEQRNYLNQAVEYFDKNCNVHFLHTSIYDLSTLKKIIKQQKLRTDCKIVCIDVMKPWRNKEKANEKLSEWQLYSMAVEELRELAVKLNIAIIITSQLTPDAMNIGQLEVSSLALGTHISFILDALIMFRDIKYNELSKFKVKICNQGHAFNNHVQTLDPSKKYMICKIVKCRGGEAGVEIVLETRKGENKFKELGKLIRA